MALFRIGKNLIINCPACPQATSCLNQITETTSIGVGAYAMYYKK